MGRAPLVVQTVVPIRVNGPPEKGLQSDHMIHKSKDHMRQNTLWSNPWFDFTPLGYKNKVLEVLGSSKLPCNIWVKIIMMGNMHFLFHFLSVFIVTWSQNEPLKS